MNITIFLSSHILSEVQQISTKIGIIQQGKLIEEIDKEALNAKTRQYLQIKVSDGGKAVHTLEKLNITEYKVIENGVIQIYEKLDDALLINRALIENGVDFYESAVLSKTLEDYFIELTGGAFHV
jgi:bacitracin transport system ATP-binding protein